MVSGCSLSSLLSCFHVLKWGGSLLLLSLSLFISTCFMHTQSSDELRGHVCSHSGYFELDVRGQTLECRAGRRWLAQPAAVTVRPWLILLSFTFLPEIYYLLPWLVFYGLMTSNRSHHQGQLQLHPLCLCSSKCNLFPPLGFFLL